MTSWSTREQHAGLGKALADDLGGVVDLPLPLRHAATVEQFDQHGDVAGLDDVEDVFAQEIDGARCNAEAEDPAPGHRPGPEIAITEGTDSPTDSDPDAGYQHVGDRDSGVDDDPEDDERRRLRHQAERAADREIPHGEPSFRAPPRWIKSRASEGFGAMRLQLQITAANAISAGTISDHQDSERNIT